MIYYFTALIISYHLNGENWQTKILYDKPSHCYDAMNGEIAMPIYEHLFNLYGNDIMMKCHETEFVSSIIKPRQRPNEK